MIKKHTPSRPKARKSKARPVPNKTPLVGTRNKRTGLSKDPSVRLSDPAVNGQPAQKDRSADTVFPVVGIGASAGGLEAFTKLLKSVPSDTGMAFVLVQHLAPAKDSILSELLTRTTSMPVHEVRDSMRVEPDHVYVIPPNTFMTIFHGALRLSPRVESPLLHMPVDSFLRSLAEDQGQNAIGVILSGTGSDGSLGIQAIKAEGGIVLAQDEQSAKYSGMPKSAVASGAVDYILPPEQIASELERISRHPVMTVLTSAKAGPLIPVREDDLNKIFMMIRTAMGVDFTHYKHSTILRRIHRRMLVHKLDTLEQYVRYLQGSPSEVGILYQDILINVTSFFRDPETFVTLRDAVFPRLIENRSPDRPIRVWVPGCSTGEEIYSLAMCFSEFTEERNIAPQVQYFASDIDEAAIDKARQGIYPDNIAQDVSADRLARFFTRTEQGYQINKAIRECCIFARQNLVKDPPFSRIDLISCRNLMIYFGPVLQKRALPILHYALNPSGYLVLGRSETVGEFSDLFSLFDKGARIYSRKKAAAEMHFNGERSSFRKDSRQRKSPEEPPSLAAGLQASADSLVLSRYGPAGLVVNADMDILLFRGNVSPYLIPQPGKASLNVMKMAAENLAMDLRVLVRQAAGKAGGVRKNGIRAEGGKACFTIDVEVTAFKVPGSRERLFLIMFEESARTTRAAKGRRRTQGRGQEDARAPLADELAATQQHLRSVVAEYEASTEELKALNEEVQSSNEELQSINEELETSQEELQSTNEELSTVNDELRTRNEEITQSNNDLVNVLSGVEIPILLIGRALQVRRFNAAAAKVLNLIAGDIGRPISDLRTNILVPDLDALIREVLDSLAICAREIQDTQGRWYSMTIRPYKTIDNRIDGVLMTLENINELKLGMQRIQEEREYAEAIVETVRDPLIVLTRDLHVVTVNSAYHKELHATPESPEGKFFYELQDGLWDIPQLRALLEHVVSEDSAFSDFAIDHVQPGNERRVLLLNARKVALERSELVLLAIEDITTRHLAEEKIGRLNADLRHSLKELETTNRELEAFSYSVSHDLRAPLNVIIGFAEVLRDRYADRLDDTGVKHLDRVIDGALRMSRTTDALLLLSRISRQEMQRQVVDLSAIAATVVAELRETQPERNTAVTIQEGLTASADAKLIEVALSNLLGNAWKFTSLKEPARIEFGASPSPPEGTTVYYVKDNGAGFDPACSEDMFMPFRRLHGDQDFAGTGIGLAIVDRVIRRHGGRIWAETQAQQGAAFFFTLNES